MSLLCTGWQQVLYLGRQCFCYEVFSVFNNLQLNLHTSKKLVLYVYFISLHAEPNDFDTSLFPYTVVNLTVKHLLWKCSSFFIINTLTTSVLQGSKK